MPLSRNSEGCIVATADDGTEDAVHLCCGDDASVEAFIADLRRFAGA